MADITKTYPFTFQSAVTANGDGSAMNVGGLSLVLVQVTGLGTATVNFEGTTEVSTFVSAVALLGVSMTTGTAATTTAANGLYAVMVGGVSQLRCRISGYSAGTVTVVGSGVVDTIEPVVVASSGSTSAVNLSQVGGAAVALGQAAMAASIPIAIASNQSSVPTAVDELPAAAALADGAANPTTTTVGADNSIWDGATWNRMPGTTAGAYSQGNVAHDAVDAGNPVKIGGVANSSAPTAVAVGDRANTWMSLTGRPMVGVGAGNATINGAGTPEGFAGANNESPRIMASATWLREHNASSWDAAEANGGRAELASASRTTTQTGGDRTNYNLRALHVVVDVTIIGTGSITPSIQGKDPNGVYYDLLVGTAITTNGTTVLKIGPGLTPTSNLTANDFLPRTYRVIITANNANAVQYSVGLNLMGA